MVIIRCDICAKRSKARWVGKTYLPNNGWWMVEFKGPFGGNRHVCSDECRMKLSSSPALRGWKDSQLRWTFLDNSDQVKYNRNQRLAEIRRIHLARQAEKDSSGQEASSN